ncbi:heme-degrading domain-containing protein [Vibrio makurazakiensis]|uniref:heme-degrading domain-containing protein n=1 Tax=Vibrio makurazakiensis TaxID=2910250 RepID=UPI003D0EE131
MSNDVLSPLLAQEHELQFGQFNNDIAWELGASLKREAEKRSASVTIEVYAFERVLFSYAMSGTSSDNQDWAKRKRRSVMRFGHSSYYLGQYNALKQREFENQQHIDATQYCAHGGAFPIRIKNCGLVGVVTVSGLPQEDDHNLVVSVLKELTNLH